MRPERAEEEYADDLQGGPGHGRRGQGDKETRRQGDGALFFLLVSLSPCLLVSLEAVSSFIGHLLPSPRRRFGLSYPRPAVPASAGPVPANGRLFSIDAP